MQSKQEQAPNKRSEQQQQQAEQVHFISKKSNASKSQIIHPAQFFPDSLYQELKVTVLSPNSISNESLTQSQKIESQIFILHVSPKQNKKYKSKHEQKQKQKQINSWQVCRKYSDFEWLYNALIFSYPGCILPYFPSKQIQSQISTKLAISMSEQEKLQYKLTLREELQSFISQIIMHENLHQAEQFKIFISPSLSQPEYLRMKKDIQMQIVQSQNQESLSYVGGIVGIFQRSYAWITSTNANNRGIDLQHTPGWAEVQKDITQWVQQIEMLITKITKLAQIKKNQIQWQGPETDIDSVQQLKAKITSSQHSNKIFLQSLQSLIPQLVPPLQTLLQLSNHLLKHRQLTQTLTHLNSIPNSNSTINRSNKLLRKRQKFENNMIRQWSKMRENLRKIVRNVQARFNCLWVGYCGRVAPVWKNK